MTGVKTQELSYDEWCELLEPFGYADITVRAPAVRFRVPPAFLEYEIRVMLKPSPGRELGEWAERSYMLEQAKQAVEVVRAAGYRLYDPPVIEFGGQYLHQPDSQPAAWIAEATLRFEVEARR